jgi:hypothetical protein
MDFHSTSCPKLVWQACYLLRWVKKLLGLEILYSDKTLKCIQLLQSVLGIEPCKNGKNYQILEDLVPTSSGLKEEA